jgi:transposase InsO family protein
LYYKKRKRISDAIFSNEVKIENILSPYYWQRRMANYFWVSVSKTSRIMQKYDIYAKIPKKRRFTKPWDKNLPHMWVDNIKKELDIVKVNQVWSWDFTHLFYKHTEFYLATMIDDYSKEIVWYKVWMHHEKELIIWALDDWITKKWLSPEISHTDQWSEYRSYKYFEALKRYSISASMSRKAAPWENWGQESFYWKFKFELWNLNRFNSIEEAIEAVHLQIHYYNNDRIHTVLKMSPVQFANSH